MNSELLLSSRAAALRLLACGVLALLPATAGAAGAFDSASARIARSDAHRLAWTHDLGGGTGRVVVVGVTVEDRHGTPPSTTPAATFNGIPMAPVAGGLAITTDGPGLLRTQLFYLPNGSLPPAGRYPVVVTLPRRADTLAGGSLSLRGLAEAAPEAVAARATGRHAQGVTTPLTTLSAEAWIVEAVGADEDDGLVPTGPGQVRRYSRDDHDVSIAGAAELAAAPGTRSLSWALRRGHGRLAHVAAAFAPLAFPLTVQVVGAGSVEPAGGSYLEGTVLQLLATAAPGHRFIGWSGDLGGATNPASLTMDGPKLVVAHFAPLYTLTTAVIGQGAVTRAPDEPEYVAGTVVQVTAVPAAGWAFAAWSGDLLGAPNPATVTMDSNKSVTATFTPDFGLHGWATVNGGTTGGEGGPEVVVDTLAALRTYAGAPGPYIIKIFGTISGNEAIRVRSNKSILGVGTGARLLGIGLQVGWNTEFGQIGNVIIRNITFEKALAPLDAVTVAYGAKNVWIDHCDFFSDRLHGVDFYDGLLDINHGADFITVSWSRFYEHYKTSLVGNSDNTGDEDAGHLTVTYHHNSFINSGGRNPSVRFGLVHAYNNYYRDLDDYAIASRMGAQVVVENNWFENVDRPIRADTSLSPVAGFVRGVETNVFLNCTPSSITTPPATWVPPYAYLLDAVADVPALVQPYAGVGVVVFDGEPPPPTPPTITQQPVSLTVNVGDDAGFSVLAEGSEPFTYQWHKDGGPITGATERTLSLPNAQLGDAGSYSVVVSNVAGTVASDPATLTVEEEPPPPPPGSTPLRERIADGERVTQALPDSAAWFTSSGSNNLLATPGQLRQIVSSSRTFLAYFTDDTAAPVTLGPGQTLTLDFAFQFTGFDSAAAASDATFRVGLLRSVANPAATSGAGFIANGPPNTVARVTGDFGSNNPGSNAFSIYSGYGAFTSVNAGGTPVPIRFYARTGSAANLLNSTTPFTQIPVGTSTASSPMTPGTAYRGRLALQHTGSSIVLTYTVRQAADELVVMSHSVVDAAATMTSFDTVAFYMSKATASANYDFLLTEVDVTRTDP